MSESLQPEIPILRALWWWRITWACLRNLIFIGLILMAFGRLNSPFENVVLCVLLFILQSVNWAFTQKVRMDVDEVLINRRLSFAILKKLGEDTTDVENALAEAELKYRRGNVIYYINLVAATVIYLGLVLKIFATVL